MTARVTLTLPKGRDEEAQWLKALAPDDAADALALAKAAHAVARSARSGADVQQALAQLRPTIEAQCEDRLRVRQAEHEAQLDLERAKAACLERESERARDELRGLSDATSRRVDELQRKHEGERAELEAQLEAAHATVHKLRSEQALFQVGAHEQADARLAQQSAMYGEQIAYAKEMHANEVARLSRLLEDATAQNAALQDGPVARMESLLTSLCGHSQKRGELGEHFVKQIHDGLELGVLTPTSHARRQGVADATWRYAPPQFADVAPLQAIVEIKFAKAGDTTEDVDKFMRDLDVAVRARECNTAIYFSLVGPIAGKKRLALEMHHGVPVLWASRDPQDDLSAASLVELAFLFLAAAWPMLAARTERDPHDSLAQQVSALLQRQVDEFARLEPRIAFLERTSEQLRKEATLLRKSRDALVAQSTHFESLHPTLFAGALVEHVEGLEERVVAAVRAYHATRRKGYLPKSIDDLARDLAAEELAALKAQPSLFHVCERRVRAENQAGKRKRKGDDDAHDAGAAAGEQRQARRRARGRVARPRAPTCTARVSVQLAPVHSVVPSNHALPRVPRRERAEPPRTARQPSAAKRVPLPPWTQRRVAVHGSPCGRSSLRGRRRW